MKKNLNLLKWNKRFKGVNITINDNKRLIKLFEGKYQQFLFRHKGTEINNKEDIINLLNRKPRSFLTTLNILVKTFKNYDHRLTAHISKLHPKQITNLTKKTSNIPKPGIGITKLSNSKLSSPKKNFEILTEKIKNLTKSLQNNKLAIPLNLFNPLLKINSTYPLAERSTNFSFNQTPVKYVQMPETHFTEIFGPNVD
jgi:ribosomal protein S15P/S13E